MHTFSRVGSRFSFIHNSDLSDYVEIVDTSNNKKFKVPGGDLIAFIAEYIRKKKISELEFLSADEILMGRSTNHEEST